MIENMKSSNSFLKEFFEFTEKSFGIFDKKFIISSFILTSISDIFCKSLIKEKKLFLSNNINPKNELLFKFLFINIYLLF